MNAKLLFGITWLSGPLLLAQPAGPNTAYFEARQLETAGKKPEAFVSYLAIPGGEAAAANIGRADPNYY